MGKNPFSFGFERYSFDFLDLKGDVEGLCEILRVESARFQVPSTPLPFLHPGISAELVVGDRAVGFLGKLHPSVTETFKIDETVYCFEFDFQALIGGARQELKVASVSKYPPVTRDLAVVADIAMPVGEIIQRIYSFQNKYLKQVELFDIYTGKEIPEGKKSVAIRVTYQALQKTLKDKEVDKIHRNLASFVTKAGDIQLR